MSQKTFRRSHRTNFREGQHTRRPEARRRKQGFMHELDEEIQEVVRENPHIQVGMYATE